jgi:hypothetical protein
VTARFSETVSREHLETAVLLAALAGPDKNQFDTGDDSVATLSHHIEFRTVFIALTLINRLGDRAISHRGWQAPTSPIFWATAWPSISPNQLDFQRPRNHSFGWAVLAIGDPHSLESGAGPQDKRFRSHRSAGCGRDYVHQQGPSLFAHEIDSAERISLLDQPTLEIGNEAVFGGLVRMGASGHSNRRHSIGRSHRL